MNYQKQYKFFKVEERLRNVDKSVPIFRYLIPLEHFLCILCFLFFKLTPQIQNSFPTVGQFIKDFQIQYLSFHSASAFSFVGNFIGLSMSVFFVTRFYICSNFDEIHSNPKLEKVLFYLSTIVGYIFQFIICLVCWSFSEIFKHQGITLAILKVFFPLTGYTYYTEKYQTTSLYGQFTIPVLILITAPQNSFSLLLVVIISAYLLLKRKFFLKKIFFSFIIITSLFVIRRSQLILSTQTTQMKMSFICFGLFVLLIPIFILKIKQKLNLANSTEKILQVFDILTNLKSDIPFKQLSFKQFYSLYNCVINLALLNRQQKSSKNDEIQIIIQANPQQVTKHNLLLIMENYLEKQTKKSSDFNILNQIILTRLRIALDYPITVLIEQIHYLHQQIQKSNKKYLYEFFTVLDLVINKFAIFTNGGLQSANTLHINELHENFEEKINKMFDKLQVFWEEMTSEQAKKTVLQSHLDDIMSLEEQVERIFKDLQKIGTLEREEKIMRIFRNLLNAYEETYKPVIDQVKRPAESIDKNVNHAFLILQDDVIKFMSKDLLRSLNEKGSLGYENSDKKVLFGEEFNHIVDNLIRNMSLKSQNDWVTIPILCKDGCIQLKKIKLMWYPSLETKNRTLIKFADDPELAQDAFMIYHCQTDTIRYFNSKLVKAFSIDQEKLQYQISNYQVFFNEIFIGTDVPAEEIKSHLKEDNSLRCKIYLKNYVEKGTPFSLPIEIKVFKSVVIDQEPAYCILKLSKLKEKKQVMGGPSTETTDNKTPGSASVNKFVSSNENMLAKKYANETFFCKIPNHYESKITEKQAQLEESGRWVHRYFIHLLFGLMFCTVLTFWVLDYKFLGDRIAKYEQQMTAIQNTSQQYALLYQCYSTALQRYFALKYPVQTFILRGLPAFLWDMFMGFGQQLFLDEFLDRYLNQINNQPNNQVDYNIDFSQFSIKTNTGSSTLMDFAQNFKRHISISDIDFLLKNYDNYRNLTIKYESSFSYDDIVEKIVSTFVFYEQIILMTVIITFCVIILIILRIQFAIKSVFDLIDLIPLKKMKKGLTRVNDKKQQIVNIFFKRNHEEHEKQLLNDKESSIRTKNSELFSLTQQQQKLSEVASQHQKTIVTQANVITLQGNFESNQNIITIKKETPEINAQKIYRIIDQPLMARLLRKLFFVIILLIISAVVLIDSQNLSVQKDGIIQIFDMKKKLYISLLHVKREQVDAVMNPTLQDYFNKTIPDTYHTDKADLIKLIPNKVILDQLNQFTQSAQQIISSNLCDYGGVCAIQTDKPCDSYMNGIISKGFKESIDPFFENGKKLAKLKLSEFGPYPCNALKCPVAAQHFFVSVLMGETVRFLITSLTYETREAFIMMKEKTKEKILIKVLGLVIMLICYIWYDSSLKKRCKRAIKLFRIIPKELMCSMKITTYMRKHNSLKMLDIL